MDLKQYIKNNYKNPNPRILETLGASKALIDYLEFTPWNTNINILDSLIDGGGSSAAVVGTAVVGTDIVG